MMREKSIRPKQNSGLLKYTAFFPDSEKTA